MKLGSNRKGYIPSKFDKSPFLNANGGPGAPVIKQQDFYNANNNGYSLQQ